MLRQPWHSSVGERERRQWAIAVAVLVALVLVLLALVLRPQPAAWPDTVNVRVTNGATVISTQVVRIR